MRIFAHFFRYLAIICALLALASFELAIPADAEGNGQVPAARSWTPEKTWVFMVGVLSWPQKADLDAFDTTHRKDAALKDYFIAQGVPADHIIYLADKNATLNNIQTKLVAELKKTSPGDFFFAYYCGHGWVTDGEAFFGNYDATDNKNCWSVKRFAQTVASNFKGATAFLTADCCSSGALGEELANAKPAFNYAVITSAISSQASTGNWTFSTGLLDCLEGHRYADANGDGAITFLELSKYLADEMRFFEKQTSSTNRSVGFSPEFCVAPVRFKNEVNPERAEAKWSGDWYPVKILEKTAKKAKVHWLEIGWDAPESDDWVNLNTIRKISSSPATATTNSAGKSTSQIYSVGETVKVESEGEFYPAKITRYRNGQYFIHYAGYDNSSDEWVEESRIKR